HLGAYADLLGKATAWEDESTAVQTYQQQQSERRHRELMQRYGQPVSLNPLSEAELPQHITEALQRARVEAALRRNGGQTCNAPSPDRRRASWGAQRLCCRSLHATRS